MSDEPLADGRLYAVRADVELVALFDGVLGFVLPPIETALVAEFAGEAVIPAAAIELALVLLSDAIARRTGK